MSSQALLSERFRIVSRLGEGAFGTVYEAIDLLHDQRVAVKVLHRVGGDAIFRFKQEFRALRDLRHPNLVELGELIERNGRYMFSMEMVRGPDLLTYVRPRAHDRHGERGGRLDETRLRDALVQLAGGLSRLHHGQTVHRDIKPSNVRVTESGRVVLLDFGLIKHANEDSGSAAASMVGTAAYMSPEQAGAGPVTAASDWYSLGVLLYEALTGRRPFTGSALQILFDKQRQVPAPPSALVESVPKDLESLCMALLQVEPERRPNGEEVLRRLGTTTPRKRFGSPQGFLGRGAELRLLHEAVDAMVAEKPPQHVFIAGQSGIGKSRMLSEWAAQVQAIYPQALLLRGGCYEAESVPFRAFDGVVDALSRYLRQLADVELEPLLPAHCGALPAVFPVLGRVGRIGREAVGYCAAADPWAARNDAFSALRHLFTQLARQRPVIVVLDDLQWADTESLQLIDRILSGKDAPGLLMVAAGCPLERCAAAVKRLVHQVLCPQGRGLLRLTGLGEEEAAHYAAELLSRHPHGWEVGDSSELARQIATQASGHPVFIEFLVRHGRDVGLPSGQVPSLGQALQHRVSTFGESERGLLRLLAVADGPLRLSILREATGLRGASFTGCVASLLTSALVAEEGVGEDGHS